MGAMTLGIDIGALENEKEHFFLARLHKVFHLLNSVKSSVYQIDLKFSPVPWSSPILRAIPFRTRFVGKRGVLKGVSSNIS